MTKESHRERQPHIAPSGFVLTWDGRLDNRKELVDKLGVGLLPDSTDLEIVAGVYQHWGTPGLANLVGDWALSIWNPEHRSILLAKDFLGKCHLYYSFEKNRVTWCTILDPLLIFADHSFQLQEEYLAGWLTSFPAPHLTPYVGIHSVPPSSFVEIASEGAQVHKYWHFDPGKKIRYRCDVEYEEHFRAVFSEAVRRRLRADRPIVAELSGGMDSSSVVCMADEILSTELAGQTLTTVSYYDNSEPRWNEGPFFMAVEQKRGCQGCHIDVSQKHNLILDFDPLHFAPTPAHGKLHSKGHREFLEWLDAHHSRVLLSGVGGDEFLGGVSNPLPELMDYFVSAEPGRFLGRLKEWALQTRKPWFHLLFEVVKALSAGDMEVPRHPCLRGDFCKRNRSSMLGHLSDRRSARGLPSFQENQKTLDMLRRQFGTTGGTGSIQFEQRFPYLDRDLLEFLFALPREQLVRPGQRRSLMRRALADIVPDLVLSRRSKGFVQRGYLNQISAELSQLRCFCEHMFLESMGVVDSSSLLNCLEGAQIGNETPIASILRVLDFECWLRHLTHHNSVQVDLLSKTSRQFYPPVCNVGRENELFSAETNTN